MTDKNQKITHLPNDIFSLILDHRTELMKEEKLKKIEEISHINFFNTMCELEENVENMVMSIEFQLEEYDEEDAEEYELHLTTCNFSEILVEQIIINNCYIEM